MPLGKAPKIRNSAKEKAVGLALTTATQLLISSLAPGENPRHI